MTMITMTKYNNKCTHCGYHWKQRVRRPKIPKECPKCKSRYWSER